MVDNKNRKRRTAGLTVPLHIGVLLTAVVTFALIYVWLDMRGEALGVRIKQLEQEQAEIQERYSNELWNWERMKSPSNIEEALSRNRIVMIWPDEGSIVRLQETVASVESLQDLAGEVAQLAQSRRSVADD